MDWTRIPSLAALRAFEAAARLRGFTPAAGELNVTPAAIAHHVRALEADLGTTLLTRAGRGLAVTAQGRILADGLSDGFGAIADAIGALRETEATRPLTLAVTPAFASNWLMPRIGDFWQRHPDLPLAIQPGIELVDLKRDGVDMAIRYGDGDWAGLQTELLTDGQFWVVAHPDLLAGRAADCVADLADLPWLMEHYVMARRDMVEGAGLSLDGVAIRPMSSNTLALSAAEAGLGVTVQPASLVERQVAAGLLVKVCELRQEPLGYYIATLPGPLPPRVATLRTWLRRQAAQ
ncbi:LysR family transcriptional regulator [uncultured Jannaschia sp.]|uniref:LysR family transcriptional regulator n=1 Tax=uncultured Jannaschia sp. TaxID=293347 RepID=UPI002619A01A|nr:LysR family transcriptional regulator [uncultured Jannaschia sp.]